MFSHMCVVHAYIQICPCFDGLVYSPFLMFLVYKNFSCFDSCQISRVTR